MNRRTRWAGLLGVGLALVGVWGAWVPHQAAALVLCGWDLAEFVKFVPGAAATRELFYLPVWCAGMALAVMIYWPGGTFAVRVGLAAVALGLMMALLPPYPDLLRGYQSPEFRWQFLLGAGGALVVLLCFLFTLRPQKTSTETVHLDHNNPQKSSERWRATITSGALVALALAGAIPALWQFLKVRGAIEAVYGASLGWGWGLGVFLAGWGLVGATGGQVLIRLGYLKS